MDLALPNFLLEIGFYNHLGLSCLLVGHHFQEYFTNNHVLQKDHAWWKAVEGSSDLALNDEEAQNG